ncbi:MAG: cytochrome c biogenesis protein CcsA [Fimbriiglobus sp.]
MNFLPVWLALNNVTLACFGLSYLAALALELLRLRRPGRVVRFAGLGWAAAGLLAHTVFLVIQHPSLASAEGAFLGLAWVLAIFSVYGSLHHTKQAWGVFVWPVVLVLVGLAYFATNQTERPLEVPTWLLGERFWGAVHGGFLLLASVGVAVAGLASAMYLEQARRLKAKRNPLGGFKMLSLERLELMNRRAINVAFPMLTVGLLLGVVMLGQWHGLQENLLSLKVLGTLGLWLVFGVLLYLRYAANVSGRRVAWLSIVSFVLVVMVLAASHPFAGGER